MQPVWEDVEERTREYRAPKPEPLHEYAPMLLRAAMDAWGEAHCTSGCLSSHTMERLLIAIQFARGERP